MDNNAAAGVHRLVLLHGHAKAREMVPSHHRQLVDIAAEVMGDETRAVGISYTGFCLTSLPHKRLPDDQPWKKVGHRVSLVVEPGHMLSRGEPKLYGVPFGARARMVLLYLQTQAVRTGTSNRVAALLWLAAVTVGRTDTALGAFYRRLSGRVGKAKAVTATARKIAVLFYNTLRHGTAYADPGASYYEERYRQRVLANLRRRAKPLGYLLQATDPTPAVAEVS